MLRLLLSAPVLGCHRASTTAEPRPSGPSARVGRSADLIVRGGDIWTLDPNRPRASAVAIAGGVIVAVGDEASVDGWNGPSTVVLDAGGGTVTPGLVDAHAHLVGLGESLATVDLRGARSIDEVVERLREGAPPQGWVIGRGWDQNLWEGAAMPTHHPLTQVFPDRPVWLRRIDGHAAWGNAALLRTAAITQRTDDPEGGEILRDGDRTPTGVLIDAAMDLVSVPTSSEAEVRAQIESAQQHILERGLTGVHDMGIGATSDAAYRRLAGDPNGLRIRVHAYAAEDWFVRDLQDQAPDPVLEGSHYALAGVKVYADGALGSHGAALLAPYADRPEHRGLLQHEERALRRVVAAAMRGGWQVATHAIGDAANRTVLDVYEEALAVAARRDPRPRIEHCQILDPRDIPRFAELGVIASMQPTHATSDMRWVPERLGPDRLAGAYAWQSLLEADAHLCFGSDFPVELPDVTHGLYAAITRQDPSGQPNEGWLPEQRVSLEQAVRGFTEEAAYAAHRELEVGRIREGMRADLTCFGRVLEEDAPAGVRDAPVLGTLVEGRPHHWAG